MSTWNVTPLILRCSDSFFVELFCSFLGFTALLASKGFNKDIKFKNGAFNGCN